LKPENNQDNLDYSTVEKLMNFLPVKYNEKIPESELIKDLILYSSEKFDILPELSVILNVKELLKFLYIFSGKHIKIPEKKVISNSLRDLDIFYSYSKNPIKQEVAKLSGKYKITSQNVLNIVNKVSKILNKPNPINP
jgi:hypothetical protein